MRPIFEIPSRIDMEAAFGAECVNSTDGYWRYLLKDHAASIANLSFNVFEGWAGFDLTIGEEQRGNLTLGGVDRIRIVDYSLQSEPRNAIQVSLHKDKLSGI